MTKGHSAYCSCNGLFLRKCARLSDGKIRRSVLQKEDDKKSCHFVLTNIVVNDMMNMTRKVVK